jgi:DNA-binding CsgD family transcriptional regulator/PAS domain-containing protein
MNELPIFISYRDEDGAPLAQWLYHILHGQTRTLPGKFLYLPTIVSPFLAPAAPAVSNWQDLLENELSRAMALIVICSPGARTDFGEDDWLYREIRWWLKHRSSIPPILVSSSSHATKWIPAIIAEKWPTTQVVRIGLSSLSASAFSPTDNQTKAVIDSILGGIVRAASEGRDHIPDSWREVGMPNQPGLYTWEKDRQGRYINANDNYAKAAGFDSPGAMIGKTDFDMPWRSLAEFFRAGDYGIVSGTGGGRIAVQEKEIMVDRVADILVCEGQLLDRFDKCVGVTGSFMDITGCQLVSRSAAELQSESGISLGKDFGNEHLTNIEIQVFRGIARSLSDERIAQELNLPRRAVASHIRSIRRKLGCPTKGDLIAIAVKSGLPIHLFGPIPEVRR